MSGTGKDRPEWEWGNMATVGVRGIWRFTTLAVWVAATWLALAAVGGDDAGTGAMIAAVLVGSTVAALWHVFGWGIVVEPLLERAGPGAERALHTAGRVVTGAAILALVLIVVWIAGYYATTRPGYRFPDGSTAVTRGEGVYDVYSRDGRHIGWLSWESDGSLGVYDAGHRLIRRWPADTKVKRGRM